MGVAVRTAADIPLRAAIAAAEGHDPSLSRSGSPDRAGAAFFWPEGGAKDFGWKLSKEEALRQGRGKRAA